MIGRRDLLISGACVAAAGAAFALKPRRTVSLMKGDSLHRILPLTFGGWTGRVVGDLVAPKKDTLAGRLYGETVQRVYSNADGLQIMMLVVHGGTQSDALQLHRPEVCYPSFGFALSQNRALRLPLSKGVELPARSLVAEAPSRRESIIYWTRLGEFLPTDGGEQRMDRLKTAMHGEIADGLLARFSIVGDEPAAMLAQLAAFIPELLRATPSPHRAALIGTGLARALAQAG